MKKIDHVTRKLMGGALALGMVLLATRGSAETIPQVIQVIQVKGNARYASDNKNWHDIKQGDIIQPGVVIQTATHSMVDLQITDQQLASGFQATRGQQAGGASGFAPPPSGSSSSTEEPKANIIRILESSVLAVDKVMVERTSVDEVTDTQLDLRAGRILGNVKKLSASSKYEIKIPNGVAGIRGSFYDLTASGYLKMYSGSSILAVVGPDGSVKTWLINPMHGFNPTEGVIFTLPPNEAPPGDFPGPINWGHQGPPFIPPYCPPPISPVR